MPSDETTKYLIEGPLRFKLLKVLETYRIGEYMDLKVGDKVMRFKIKDMHDELLNTGVLKDVEEDKKED